MSRLIDLVKIIGSYWWKNGGLDSQVEDTPLGQSGVPFLPGGECFAPYLLMIFTKSINLDMDPNHF